MKKDRSLVLDELAEFITSKLSKGEVVNLNFICTHNSRRSHLAQIWSSVAIFDLGIQNVYSYSGGTEATAVFPKIIETIRKQGLMVHNLSNGENPIYGIKPTRDAPPILAFSKKYDDPINPSGSFIAVMTCNHADQNCPIISGAEKRFAITYEDPKVSDGSPEQDHIYMERSLQIRNEMDYVFEKVNQKK